MQPTVDDARAHRLRRVLGAIGRPSDAAVPLESYSNDAWRVGDVIVRIGFRGDVRRLRREARLAPALPAATGYPAILDHGVVDGLAYTVTRAIPGTSLDHLWGSLPRPVRRRALAQICTILTAIHAVDWPADVPVEPTEPPDGSTDAEDVSTIIGASLHPVRSLPRLVERAHGLPGVPGPTLDAVADHVTRLGPGLAAADASTVTHGDLHLTNVVWHDGAVSATLDYEWAEPGTPERDVEPLIRRLSDDPTGADLADLATVVRSRAPHLVAGDRAIERIWLFRAAFEIRALFLWGSRPPYPHGHPVPQLARLAAGPESLAFLSADG